MFISPAFAQGAGGAGGDPILPTILMFVAIFGVFYFFIIRPQTKKAKEHKQLVDNLRRGDRIVSSGGLVGVVTRVIDNAYIQVEIAEGVRVRMTRVHVQEVLNKTDTPAETKSPKLSKRSKNSDSDTTANDAGKAS